VLVSLPASMNITGVTNSVVKQATDQQRNEVKCKCGFITPGDIAF
jgi:hypothetical protein